LLSSVYSNLKESGLPFVMKPNLVWIPSWWARAPENIRKLWFSKRNREWVEEPSCWFWKEWQNFHWLQLGTSQAHWA